MKHAGTRAYLRRIEKKMTVLALKRFDEIEAQRKGTPEVIRRLANPEDRLWELTRIADALESRLRTMEERTRC